MTCVWATEYKGDLPGTIPDKLLQKTFVCCNDALDRFDGPVVHALHRQLPECSLKEGTTMPWQIERGDVCRIYCAQPTCSAALDMLKERVNDFERCSKILYMHDGALNLEPALLKNGPACHQKIDGYNSGIVAG